jgi:hypothetical protein
MATAKHRARFPDTFPPLPQRPDEAKELASEKKSETDANGEKAPEVMLAVRGLTLEQKRFVVESFACFQGVNEIAAELRRRWGINLDQRHISLYDAGRATCRMGRALRTYYDQCRKAYVEGTAQVAIAHQSHRLRLVGRIVEKATTSKDYNAALKGLELAAKEMGGALSGHTTVRHEGMIGHVHATVEEARAELAARLTQVVEGGTMLAISTAHGTHTDPEEPTISAIPEG